MDFLSTTWEFHKMSIEVSRKREKVHFIDFVEFAMNEPPCLSYNCVISQRDELLKGDSQHDELWILAGADRVYEYLFVWSGTIVLAIYIYYINN